MATAVRNMGDVIITSILVSLILLTCFTTFRSTFSQTNTTSPFSNGNAKIESVSSHTSDEKYFVNLHKRKIENNIDDIIGQVIELAKRNPK